MTTEQQEEAGPVTVQIGVCSVCHALFLMSGERLTSPCHGSDTLAILATLTIGPNAEVTGEWGFGPLISAEEMKEKLELPAEEEAPAPVAEEEAEEEGPVETALDIARSTIALYVALDMHNRQEVVEALEKAGAEPEAAVTAVGRLAAVRELLEQLSAAREPAPVAAAPPEAESSPENT